MPAEFESGFFYREPAWHRGGNVAMEEIHDWNEARLLADLDWEPEEVNVATSFTNRHGGVLYTPAPGYKGIVRSDTKELLSIQSSAYAIIDHTEMGSIIEYVLHNVPQVRYEALVVLKGGRIVTATLWLGEPIQLPGDPSVTRPLLVVSARHDGRGGLRLGPSAIRVVCANTQQWAERDIDTSGMGFTIRHTTNWADRVNDAKRAIEASLASVDVFKNMARELAEEKLIGVSVEDFLDQWMPYSTDQNEAQRAGVARRRAKFMSCWENETTMAGMPDTKWKLLQAATEYCDWMVNHRSPDTQVAKQLVSGDPAKAKALAIIGSL